ncbi:hypothetical protein KRX54_04750 [Actinomycetaceae bacterium TAE3-ERU4]|nr:hypothetical protein [Actinomycetaceae bacterium TAE3-ERU4]
MTIQKITIKISVSFILTVVLLSSSISVAMGTNEEKNVEITSEVSGNKFSISAEESVGRRNAIQKKVLASSVSSGVPEGFAWRRVCWDWKLRKVGSPLSREESLYEYYAEEALARKVNNTFGPGASLGKNCSALYDMLYPRGPKKDIPRPRGVSPQVKNILRDKVQRSIEGRGIHIQPDGRHIPDKDAIIYADVTEQELTVNIADKEILVHLHAIRYEADLGDGGKVLSTTKKPLPYPEGKHGQMHRKFTHTGTFYPIYRIYWEVNFTDPFTKEKITLPNPLVTTQKGKAQLVKPYEIFNTDDAEELNGH